MRNRMFFAAVAALLSASPWALAQQPTNIDVKQSAPRLDAPIDAGAGQFTGEKKELPDVAGKQPAVGDKKAPAGVVGQPVLPPGIIPASNVARPYQTWATTEYLLWFSKNSPSPPLAISQPGNGLNSTTKIPTSPGFIGLSTQSTAGALSLDNTQSGTLFGNNIRNDLGSGVRFTFGGWLDTEQTFGMEGRYMLMITTTTYHPTNGIIGIPYRDAITGKETAYLVNTGSGPYTAITQVSVNTTPAVFVHLFNTYDTQYGGGILNIRATSVLQGGEANAIANLGRGANWHAEGIFGFRFLELDETLQIDTTQNSPITVTRFEPALGLPTGAIPVVTGLTGLLSRTDSFRTHNSFYGGQIGVRGEYFWDRLSLSGALQVGFGEMQESVDIAGVSSATGIMTSTPRNNIFLAGIPLTVATSPAVPTKGTNVVNGGLFAQPTNSGHFTHNVFAVVPEGLLQLNYRFTERISGSLGYTFLFVSNVARPGDQIDRNPNPAPVLVPVTPTSTTQPSFQFHTTDYWAQGLNVGLTFKF